MAPSSRGWGPGPGCVALEALLSEGAPHEAVDVPAGVRMLRRSRAFDRGFSDALAGCLASVADVAGGPEHALDALLSFEAPPKLLAQLVVAALDPGAPPRGDLGPDPNV